MRDPDVEKAADQIADDYFRGVEGGAEDAISRRAAKLSFGYVNSLDEDHSADVKREYSSTTDGVNYPMIASGYRPKPGDPVWMNDRAGDTIVLGKEWQPGMQDIEDVRSGDLKDNAIASRVLGNGSVRSDAIQANAVRGSEMAKDAVSGDTLKDKGVGDGKLAQNYSQGGHGHQKADISNFSHTHNAADLPSLGLSKSDFSEDAQGYLKFRK